MSALAILDIDGTLVDTNYQHAIAWYRAFRTHKIVLPVWRVHRHIGMGGDHMIAALTDPDTEGTIGDDIRASEKALYQELIEEVEPMDGAARFIRELKARAHCVILASSAKAEEVDHYLDLLGVRDDVDGWTTSADVEGTKPEPDLVHSALEKGEGRPAIMVGDSTFDCEAATRAGVETIGVLTGGFSRQELTGAGAIAVFDSIAELTDRLDDTPLK